MRVILYPVHIHDRVFLEFANVRDISGFDSSAKWLQFDVDKQRHRWQKKLLAGFIIEEQTEKEEKHE